MNQYITFMEYSEKWISIKKSIHKPATTVKYKNLLKKHICPNIGNKTINQIDYQDITLLCANLLDKGKSDSVSLSAKTVNDILSLIKKILKDATVYYSIDCRIFTITIPNKYHQMRVLTVSEEKKLIEYLLENITTVNLGILISIFSGIRIGELCALSWDDICFDEHYISIHATMQRLQTDSEDTKTQIVITEPKSFCSIRKIPLPTAIFAILDSYKYSTGYFLTQRSNKYIEPRTIQNHIQRIYKQCNIENAHFHTLRHTFATRCIEKGVDPKCLSEMLGHSSVNITLNRYVHPSMETKTENINKLENLLPDRFLL